MVGWSQVAGPWTHDPIHSSPRHLVRKSGLGPKLLINKVLALVAARQTEFDWIPSQDPAPRNTPRAFPTSIRV